MKINDFERAQDIIRKDMLRELQEGHITQVVKLIETFSEVTLRLNNIKSDGTVENVLKALSEKYIGLPSNSGKKKDNLIVFYDQVGTTVCLGLQYLRGLVAAGYEIYYIYENYRNKISPLLLREIKSLNIEYKLFGPDTPIFENGIYSGKIICDFINSIKPCKILVHPLPNEAIGMSVMYALPHIEKFIVVPGDHHFYAGLNSCDYLIEFRKFGVSVSVKERGIDVNRIFKLPYYPIIDELTEFKGLPVATKGKVVYACAGATYKFVGSDIIYKLWNAILSHDNTLIIYMGKADKKIQKYIKNNGYENRFILLGYRKDFVQCIKEIDALVNSYPFGGGLVTQTAAFLQKPIIAYCDEREYFAKNLADIFGGDGNKDKFTKTSLQETLSLIDKVSNDENYRKEFGERLGRSMQTKESFDETLHRILNHTEKKADESDVYDYDKGFILKRYLDQQNLWHPTVFVPLLVYYGFTFFWKFKFMYKDMLKNPFYTLKFLGLHVYKSFK